MKRIPKQEEKVEPGCGSCCCMCMQPILCSCYKCMTWLLAKVFIAVATCFLIYYGLLTIVQRREPREAFFMALKDIAGMIYPSKSKDT